MEKKVIVLNKGWKFHLGECEEAWYKGYADDAWRTVWVPHDWSVEAPFSKKYSSGTGYVQGGIGWYRLRFSLPEEYEGKSVRVVFDGVYKNSQVWCNSYYLGKRPSGYTSFSYDISDFVVFGATDNVICVKVTHNDLADSRWFTGSGITRKVTLVVEEKVHPVEYGCFFENISVDKNRARVKVTCEIENNNDTNVMTDVRLSLCDTDNVEVLSADSSVLVPALIDKLEDNKLITSIELDGEVNNPHLWSVDNPYLYTMNIYMKNEKCDWYLADSQLVGIREIEFNPDTGFFLNGENLKIKGVCVHHDAGCLGAAVTPEVWKRRLEALKKCGCNAIRCSHNPHMPELYSLCDSMGFVMMDEAFDEWENPKNKWSTGHNVYPPKHQGYYEDFHQWHEKDLRAMVRRDRNHPSVIMYSVGNEIDYPNDPYCHPMFETMTGNNDSNKPAAERMYDTNKPNAERLTVIAKHLVSIVKDEDTTRPVTLAAAFPELSSKIGFIDNLDVVGYNYKEHLYEEDHKRFPQKPFLGSENGHGYEAWLAVKDNEYISGQFLWTGIDYLGEAHGWPVHGSPAGIITTAGYEKPEWYRRRCLWGQNIDLHLATKRYADHENAVKNHDWNFMSHSWNYEAGEEILVRCYLNEDLVPEGSEIILYINDKAVSRATVGKKYHDSNWEDGSYVFKIPYESGVLKAECKDAATQKVVDSFELESTGAAEQVVGEVWKDNDMLSEGNQKEGYVYQLLLSLTDSQNRLVVSDDSDVRVQVTGDGELIGLDNGNLSDLTPFCQNIRCTKDGKLVAYIRKTGKGHIEVTVKLCKSIDNETIFSLS